MPVNEETLERIQGYSIVRITETDSHEQPQMVTYALHYESGGQLDEFADYVDAVHALNRILFPLPGIPKSRLQNNAV